MVSRACDSLSWDREFKSHVGNRVYLEEEEEEEKMSGTEIHCMAPYSNEGIRQGFVRISMYFTPLFYLNDSLPWLPR